MEAVVDQGLSVVLSSHLVADLERVCDYLIVLTAGRVQVDGEVDELLASHHLLTGERRDPATLPAGQHVISASHTDRQTTLTVRTEAPIHDPAWTVSPVGLEDPRPRLYEQRRRLPAPPPPHPGGIAMMWLTWRQFRAQAWVALAALAALAITFAVTGPHLAHPMTPAGSRPARPAATARRPPATFWTWCGAASPTRSCTSSVPGSCTSHLPSSACSGERRWSPVSWRRALTGSYGTSPSPAPGGWRSSSA